MHFVTTNVRAKRRKTNFFTDNLREKISNAFTKKFKKIPQNYR